MSTVLIKRQLEDEKPFWSWHETRTYEQFRISPEFISETEALEWRNEMRHFRPYDHAMDPFHGEVLEKQYF
tara:strand:+ start:135 stop:347 length:213 start_codon:yes stop_codon:yes gene_type:complete